jgi:hypothetical protein
MHNVQDISVKCPQACDDLLHLINHLKGFLVSSYKDGEVDGRWVLKKLG